MVRIGNTTVEYKKANSDFSTRWQDFNSCTQVLPTGWVKAPGRRPLAEDLILDKDCAIPLRDGLKIWADVFRPPNSNSQPVPAIIAWSPYGKEGNGWTDLPILSFDSLKYAQIIRVSTLSLSVLAYLEIGQVI